MSYHASYCTRILSHAAHYDVAVDSSVKHLAPGIQYPKEQHAPARVPKDTTEDNRAWEASLNGLQEG